MLLLLLALADHLSDHWFNVLAFVAAAIVHRSSLRFDASGG